MLYVLDEPSIGLHSRDTHRLIKILHAATQTILVVEHYPDVSASTAFDLGPGAEESGGQVIASGSYDDILKTPGSLTGRYLSADSHPASCGSRRKPVWQIKISGARAHNLKNIDLAVPLGMLVAIT